MIRLCSVWLRSLTKYFITVVAAHLNGVCELKLLSLQQKFKLNKKIGNRGGLGLKARQCQFQIIENADMNFVKPRCADYIR